MLSVTSSPAIISGSLIFRRMYTGIKNKLKGLTKKGRISRNHGKRSFLCIDFCEEPSYFTLNFVNSPLLNDIEFCEISENGINFPPRQVSANVIKCIAIKK